MTDISVVTTPYQVEKRSWLISSHGAEDAGTTLSITLDISKFTAGTHYPNGYIPSGTVVAKVTSTGLWGPADTTATDGRQTFGDGTIGILFNSAPVVKGTYTATKLGNAILVHGFVNTLKLPFSTSTAGGLETGTQAAMRLIYFTAGE